MTILYFHHTVDANTGRVLDQHFIDADDPATIASLTALSGNVAAQTQAGWRNPVSFTGIVAGQTQWDSLKARLATLPAAHPLKVIV